MGQVIRFPKLLDHLSGAAYRPRDGEAVLLVGLRFWVDDVRHRQDPVPRLRRGMQLAGAPEVAHAIDALMTIAARTARHVLEFHGPRCDCLSLDETHMLQAASLVQAGDTARAERVLRTALLTAQGAEMALVPLQGIGRLFSVARLLLRRRPLAMAAAPDPVAGETGATLH